MGFFNRLANRLESPEMRCKKSHIKNMYLIAMSDGFMDNNEFDFILNVARNKLYMDGSVVQNIIANLDDVPFQMPPNPRERVSYLEDYVFLVLSDGKINNAELTACKHIAASYGFRTQIIDDLIREIIQNMATGIAKEIALRDALARL